MFPDGYRTLSEARRRFGSLTFATNHDPAVFWILARGIITPSLLREELTIVRAFGAEHPEGWDYVVDTTRVSVIHPLNVLILRSIHTLPNIRRYVIVASPVVRALAGISATLIRPTSIVRSSREAQRLVSTRLVSESGKW